MSSPLRARHTREVHEKATTLLAAGRKHVKGAVGWSYRLKLKSPSALARFAGSFVHLGDFFLKRFLQAGATTRTIG